MQTQLDEGVRPSRTRRHTGAIAAATSWLAVAAGVVAVSVAAGVGTLDAVVYLLAWILSTTVPGVLIWRTLATPASLAEELGFGNALGIALLLLAWVPAVLIGDAGLAWWGPATVVAGYVAVPSLRRHWRPSRRSADATPWGWHVATALVCLATLGYQYVTMLRKRPLPGVDDTRVHPDIWFQQGLVNQLEHTLQVTEPQAAGESKEYHWLSNADVAATAHLSGVPSTTVLFILWFVLMMVSMVLAATAFARRLMGADGSAGRLWWVGPAGALFVAAVPVVVLLGEPRQQAITNGFMQVSPSGVLGLLLILALSGAMIELLRCPDGRGTWIVVLLLMAAAAGTKPSNLPIAIAALLAVAVVQYVRTRRIPLGPLALVVIAGAMILASSFVLLGGTAGSSVVPFDTLRLDEAVRAATDRGDGLALVATGAFGLYLGTQASRLMGLSGIFYRRTRHDIGIWWAAAVVFAGWCASWLVLQPGYSQRYFWRVVIVLALMTSVVVATRIACDLPPRVLAGPLLTVAVAGLAVGTWVLQWNEYDVTNPDTGPFDRLLPYGLALVVFAACVLGWRLRSRVAALAVVPVASLALVFTLAAGTPAAVDDLRVPVERALTGQPLPYTDRDLPRLVTEDEQDAALWLRRNADDGAVVTNVFCVPTRYESGCQATAFWVASLSNRSVVLGGWAYIEQGRGETDRDGPSYKRQPSPFPERFRLSLDMIRDPSASVARTLKSTYGAEWIFADRRASDVSSRIKRYADLVHSNEDVTIYRLR